MRPKVSIILRTKNEEKWLKACIKSIRQQSWKSYEIILVDNQSSDATVKVAESLGVDKIRHIDRYKPGAALNLGVSASDGDICVFLSAHCVAADAKWLDRLVCPIVDGAVPAVYGRQIPTSKTNPDNCRDLLMTFGKESFDQSLDIKFHNANSAVAKDVIDKYPFDDNISNIEDWIWAKNLIGHGFKIRYAADAMVFHHHGINQHEDNIESFRAGKVSQILHGLYYPSEIEEPFFSYENWKTLIVLSKPTDEDVAKIKTLYEDEDLILVNTEKVTNSGECLTIDVDRSIDFLTYLQEVLRCAENARGVLYDSLCFVDFSYAKIDINFVQKNISELYRNWADISSVGRRIVGKTFSLDLKDKSNITDTIFPSSREQSNVVELVLGYCAAVRASVIRLGEGNNKLEYHVSELLEHHTTIKVAK